MDDQTGQLIGAYRLGRRLRLPGEWLENEARQGRLPHINADGRIVFNESAVRRVLAKRAAREGVAS